jgi:hypothetical protein
LGTIAKSIGACTSSLLAVLLDCPYTVIDVGVHPEYLTTIFCPARGARIRRRGLTMYEVMNPGKRGGSFMERECWDVAERHQHGQCSGGVEEIVNEA